MPEERIAQTPLADRSSSRLLVLDRRSGNVQHRRFSDLPNLLDPGDLIVVNETRVSARRLRGNKSTGGKVEALIIRPAPTPGHVIALVRPARSLRPGVRIQFAVGEAEVVAILDEGHRELRWIDPGSEWQTGGEVPLPPYIHEPKAEESRYQTVFGCRAGSAAAPTAGLHMDEPLLRAISQRQVDVARVSLDIGVDTFRPIQVDEIEDHRMHGEVCRIDPQAATAINATKGRIVAIGTTTVRTLESFAVGSREVKAGEMETTLYIRPGFSPSVVDAIVTNFHMPRSSLLVMLSAFCPLNYLLCAYEEAIRENYRFLSFGDAMFIV